MSFFFFEDDIENEHIEAMSGSGHSGVSLIMKKVDLELNRGNFTKAVQYCLTFYVYFDLHCVSVFL